jgi:hypothetical protein
MINEVSKNRHTHCDLLTPESSVKWDDKWDMPTSPLSQESNEMISSMFTHLSIKYPMRWWMRCQVMRCPFPFMPSVKWDCCPLPSLSRVKWDDKFNVVYSPFFQVSDEMINEMSNELSIPLSSKCEMGWQMRWCPFPSLPSVKWDDKWDDVHSPLFQVSNEMTSIPLSSKSEMRWQMRWRPFPCLPSVKWGDK